MKFTDKSTDDGRIVAWHWEFGDGTESSEQNPEHRYAEKGEFTIALTVTDNGELKGTVEKSIVVGTQRRSQRSASHRSLPRQAKS